MAVTVRVPATSANLGPGFDCFAVALGLYDQFTAEDADTWEVTVEGEAAGSVPVGRDNRTALAMRRVFEEAGETGRAAKVESITRMPPGRGLGTSAAATVAGLLMANAMVEHPLGEARMLALAAEIDGHADNVAAAIQGGVTLTWEGEDGPSVIRLEPSVGFAAVMVVSEGTLETATSRELLPESVPTADAAFNAGRAALLVAGLLMGRSDLAREGFADRLHEPYRAERIADLEPVRKILLVAGADGAVLSGSGPTVAGILLDEDDTLAFKRAVTVAEKAERLLADFHGRKAPLALPIDRRGAAVL